MKKIIGYSILLIVMISIGISQVKSTPNIPSPLTGSPGEWMLVSFSFGNINKDCNGFGICILYIYTERSVEPSFLNRESDAKGYVYFDDDGVFTIEFIKDQMSDEIRRTFFNGDFKMEAPFEIPNQVLVNFNRTDKYTIQPGNYEVEDRDGRFKVKFDQ